VRFVSMPKPPRPKPTSTSSKPSKPGYGDADAEKLCEAKRKLKRPRIEIDDVRSRGNMFSNKYRIEGSVVGACIEEAVYVEDGELEERIMTRLSPRVKRYPLKLNVRSGRRGVIRVLNSNGDEDRIKVDRLIESYESRKPW